MAVVVGLTLSAGQRRRKPECPRSSGSELEKVQGVKDQFINLNSALAH